QTSPSPHEYDCTKFYYCEYGLRWTTPRDCAPGTEFSYEKQVCIHPTLANCTLPGVPPTDPPSETPSLPEEPSTEPCEDEILPNGCPSDFNVHLLLPHENNCSKFYYCVFGDKVERECPAGTHFNPKIQVCDWPENAGCESGNNCNGNCTTGNPTTPAPVTEEDQPTEPCEDGFLPNGCPADFDVHHLLPHEDCGKFYYCVFGEKVERDCPAGLHFNVELQVCDWPNVAGCEAPSNPCTPGGDGSCSGSSSQAPSTAAPSTEKPCDKDERLPNGCPACFDVHLLLPAADCGKFYYCVFGDKVERDCPPGLHFNAELQVCDWPNVAGCEAPSNPCTPGGSGSCNGSSTTEASPTNPPITEPTTTPKPTPEEDCDTTTAEPCDEDARLPNGCPVCRDVHLLLPSDDCTKFYYCVEGEKEERVCPDGLHFNPELQVCDWPAAAGCEAPSNPCTPEGGGSCNGSSTTEASPTNPPITEPTTTPEPTPEEDCDTTTAEPCDEDARLPNGCPVCRDVHLLLPSDDCTKFYYCVDGEKQERVCPDDLHFNPVLQVCDWPAAAGCEAPSNPCTPEGGGSCNGSSTTEASPTNPPITEPTTTPEPTPEEDCDTTTAEPCDEDARLPNGCPVCRDVHLLLPSDDCTKFYYCVDGEKQERVCPDNLHFNPVLQVCDWPSAAGCEAPSNPCTPEGGGSCNGSSTTEASPTNPPITEPTTTPEPTPEEDCDTTTAEPCDEDARLPNGCPVCRDVHLLLPSDDCTKFYYCVDGEKQERVCPDDLHFNPVLQVCDWPSAAGCEAPSNPCTPEGGGSCNGSSTTEASPTNPPITEPTTTPEPTPEEDCDTTTAEPCDEDARLPNGCPVCRDVHLLLPSDDCTKFYYCVDGEKQERVCPDDLHFNPVLQVCDWPSAAGCEAPSNPCTPEGGGSCNGSSTTEASPTNPPITEPTTTPEPTPEEDCDTTTAEPCDEDARLPNGCPVCRDVHLLLPSDDCTKFYYCVDGEKQERVCPDDLHFNPVLQVCDWPSAAGCEAPSNPCTPEGGGSCNGSSTTEASPTNPPITEPTTTPEPIPEEDCDTTTAEPCDEDARLPNGCPVCRDVHLLLPSDDCTKFYYCVDGEKQERVCPDDLHFNPVLQVCDWPASAGCEAPSNPCTPGGGGSCNGSSTTEASTTETSTTEEPTTEATTTETSTTQSSTTEASTTEELTTDASTTEASTTEEPTTEATTTEASTTQSSTTEASTTEELTTDASTTEAWTTQSSTTEEPTTEATTTEASTTQSSTTQASTTEATLPPVPEPNKCVDECNALPWADEDCDKFWRCEGNNPILVTCSEGLHFNPTTLTCDFICNAGCERDEIQKTASANGIRIYVPWNKMDALYTLVAEKQI
ncbi:uncharacterized protein ACR2FA_010455, partial [Aphomia sociella]